MAPPPLSSILNFRDAGRSVNEAMGRSVLQHGKLYRGARPDEASPADRKALVGDWGIKSIIDLRSKTEIMEAVKRHGARVHLSALNPQTPDEIMEPLKMPEVTYYEIDFNGGYFQQRLIQQLSWYSYLKMVALYVAGYRLEAISIPCREVLQPAGLVGLSLGMLEASGNELVDVFHVLAEPANYPVMLHCTQGKDRTGLTIALALFLVGASCEAVTADYIKSEKELEPEHDERMKEVRAIGLDETFTKCPPELMPKIHEHIINRHGSVEQYLESVGVTRELQERVKTILAA